MYEILHNDECLDFELIVNGVVVATLNLYEEGDDDEQWNIKKAYWLNGIYSKVHLKGYATELIEKAIQIHGHILISSASSQEHKDHGDMTARELTDDGMKFIKKLIEKGIIRKTWCINPFQSRY